MKAIEGEAVAGQVNHNRAWTQMDANLDCGCLAALKRKDAVIGSCPALKEGSRKGSVRREAIHGSRCVAAAFRRDKADRGSNQLDFGTGAPRLASLGDVPDNFRKSLIFNLDLRKSLIFNLGLTQVVDFHVIFRYFPIVADISNAFLRMRKTRLAQRRRFARPSTESLKRETRLWPRRRCFKLCSRCFVA